MWILCNNKYSKKMRKRNNERITQEEEAEECKKKEQDEEQQQQQQQQRQQKQVTRRMRSWNNNNKQKKKKKKKRNHNNSNKKKNKKEKHVTSTDVLLSIFRELPIKFCFHWGITIFQKHTCVFFFTFLCDCIFLQLQKSVAFIFCKSWTRLILWNFIEPVQVHRRDNQYVIVVFFNVFSEAEITVYRLLLFL